MSKYLLEVQAKTRLSLGKSIAQILSSEDEDGHTILKWLTVDTGDEKAYSVAYHEVFDEGTLDDFNIHEFSRLDPENLPHGVINEFNNIEDALSFAKNTYGASVHMYVAESMIEDEYGDFFKKSRNG